MPTARGRYRSSPATLTNADEADLLLDSTGKLQVAGSFVVDSEFPAAAALADNTANPTTTCVAAMLMCFDGTTWDRAVNTAASTGATRAQQGLVVSVSPNSPYTVATQKTAANAFVALASAGVLKDFTVQIPAAIASNTYYLMALDAAAAASNGAVTNIIAPIEIVHALGSTDTVRFDDLMAAGAAGITFMLSTTAGNTLTLVASSVMGTARVIA